MVLVTTPPPPPIAVSQHAVDRYRARWARTVDEATARDHLDAALAASRVVRTYPDGDRLLRGPRPKCLRLVVGQRDGVPTLVTVLPPYGEETDPDDRCPAGLLSLPDFQDVPGHPGKRSALACRICRVPVLPAREQQSTCGAPACRNEFREQVAAYRRRHDPDFREREQARCQQWSTQPRNQDKRRADNAERMRRVRAEARGKGQVTPAPVPDPVVKVAPAPPDLWAAPGPDLGTHLPGAWRELVLNPPPAVPIPHTHATSLHGIACRSVGLEHDRTRADFVLRQDRVRSGWGVYFVDGAVARRLSCAPMPGLHLEGRPWGICYGPGVVVPRAPSHIPAGRYRVTLTTLSPVVIRRSADGKTLVRIAPTAASLRASLTGLEFFRRLGWTERKPPAWTRDVVLLLCGHDTRRERVDSDGHWNAGDGQGHGFVTGWSGTVEIETNAPGLALLRCAEVVGLGGRVAVGFGQVRVTVDGPLDGRG